MFAPLVQIYVIARLSRSREIPTNAISACVYIYTCRSDLRHSRQKRLFVVLVFIYFYFLLLHRPRFRSAKRSCFLYLFIYFFPPMKHKTFKLALCTRTYTIHYTYT